jgi:hypothetical protein
MKNLIVKIFVLTVVLSLTGCQLGSNKPLQSTSEPASEVRIETKPTEMVPVPLSSSDDPISIIFQSVEMTSQHFPRTLQSEVSSASSTSPSILSMALEDNGKVSLRVENPDGSVFAGVVISPTVYINQMGTWEVFTGEIAQSWMQDFRDLDQFNEDEISQMGNNSPVLKGSEIVSGVETSIFSFKVLISDGVDSQANLWIGNQDHLIYKYSIEGSNGTRTEAIYDFTTPVTVVQPVEQTVSDLGSTAQDLCGLLTPELITPVIGRELNGDPVSFHDDYLGDGCSFNFGSDNSAEYFMYFALAPSTSYDDSKLNGSDVTTQTNFSQEAFTVNAADAQQLWVRLNNYESLVIAIGDRPNPEAAKQMAKIMLGLLLAMPK